MSNEGDDDLDTPTGSERIKACVEEINRLDFLLVAGAKRESLPPPQKEIFDALSKAAHCLCGRGRDGRRKANSHRRSRSHSVAASRDHRSCRHAQSLCQLGSLAAELAFTHP
jgi:hypothetical protein